MTTIISHGVDIIFVLLVSLTPVFGTVGSECTIDTPCDVNERCESSYCECNTGFAAIGDKCVKECPNLSDIEFGSVQVVANATTIQFEAVYTCTSGYELVGLPKRLCQDTGTWEEKAPLCRDDPCDPNPCNTADPPYPCVKHKDVPDQHVCICPVGKKGPDCSESDPPITCRSSREKRIYFEEKPTVENRTACLPKTDSTSENVCYNQAEGIVYRFDATNEITIDDSKPDRYCFTYQDIEPDVTEKCVSITAFEADDIEYRPWINATFQFCYRFNSPPTIIYPSPHNPLRFNVANLPDQIKLNLQVTDPDPHQQLSWTVTEVAIVGLQGRFSINGSYLVIQNPSDLATTNPDIFNQSFNLEITVTDDGIPSLQESVNISMEFINEELTCTVPDDIFYVNLEPAPTQDVRLGKIDCRAEGQTQTPIFEILADAGPVRIESDGSIYVVSTTAMKGRFNIDVRANVTLTVPVSTIVRFTVFAENFNPDCDRTQLPFPVPFSEKATLGTCNNAVIYQCDDHGKFPKTCSDSSTLFDVQCENVALNVTEVKICSASSLDDSAGSTESVNVTVTNKFGTDEITITVTVTNINDPPVFMVNNSQIDISISEYTAIAAVVGDVLPVADPDVDLDPPLDTLSVTITDLENIEDASLLPFGATVTFDNSITLTLVKELKPKVRDSYLLELKVKDTAGESDTVNLNITVTDVNEKPTCVSTNIKASASVRSAVDDIIVRLTCVDDDFSDFFRTLSYKIEGESPAIDYFKIDSNGVIQVKQELTTFTSGIQLSFIARVTDGEGLTEAVQVTVDVNSSYPPACASYDITEIKTEKTAKDECFLVSVNCSDPVNAETLTFGDVTGNGSSLFTLNSDLTNNDDISLCSAVSLQGQVGDWQINLLAKSSYGSKNIQVTIRVTDVNDPPTCPKQQLDIDLSVKNVSDAIVTTLTCSDPDINPTYSTLRYTLEGQADVLAYFKLDDNVIKLATPLYDVTGSELKFTVRVEDGGSLFTSIAVTTTINKNFPPVCTKTEYEGQKSENTVADVCFTQEVGCTDEVRNGALKYTFTSGNGTHLFREDASSGGQLRICTEQDLQGQYGTWQLGVTVNSTFGETQFSLIIGVSDKNDNPSFTQANYTGSVREDAIVGTLVLTLSATDPDSGAYGRITYASTQLETSGLFSLDRNTGKITVISTLDADRIDSNWYYFEAKVEDGASLPLSATTSVSIQVTDINDESPVCQQQTNVQSISLLVTNDTLITQLDCTDADRTPAFNTLKYSTTSPYFSVNAKGEIRVAGSLPRDVTRHDVTVNVVDSDKPTDPDFATTVSIVIAVDNVIPPVCTPAQIVSSLLETEDVDVCLDKQVICTDPTGGNVTLVSQSGTAKTANLLVIKLHSDPEKLGLSACVASSLKDKFGTYSLIATVSNGLASTRINWTLTVENVNEAPVFNTAVYDVEVPENHPVNQQILTFTVTDPDDGKGNFAFELDKVMSVSTNDEAFGSALSDSILYIDVVRSYRAYRPFNATVRDVYTYIVTAVDRSGLQSTANITIRIKDVNSAPVCQPAAIMGNTDILAEENTVIANIFCWDTDLEPEYIQLDYKIVSGDQGGYFNVTNGGNIIVQKPLPRDSLYGTGRANLQVTVSDRGVPPLNTDVTVTVTVDNTIPASCSPVVIPPSVWVQNKCVIIKMDCTDPTIAGTDHLRYTTYGNFSAGFTETSNSLGTIELCYNLIISGTFQISVSVDNGLSIYTFTDNIVVSYSKASPVFSTSKYTDTISEITAVNTIVMKVDASSADLIGDLEYNVIGSESTEGAGNFFSLDKTTGLIQTIASIKGLADRIITLKIEACDTASKLCSSVPVELTVQDLNEPPTCLVSSTYLNLVVDADVDTSVAVFSCSDPDVKEEFKTLSYSILGSNVDGYFKLIGTPATSIAVKSPLNVLIQSYTITLTVSDNAVTPKTYTREFKVNVNILPPPVVVQATSLSYDTISVKWQYTRADYYDVTNSFKVKALSADNIVVKNSGALESGTRQYNFTGLQEETPYTIVVEAVTDVGTRSSVAITVTTKQIPILTYFTATFVLERDYNERLRDRLSQIYYQYRKDIVDNVGFILKDTPGFVELTDVSFRPYNSIYVDIQGSVNQSGNVYTTIEKLNATVSTGWVKLLSVQSDYFQASAGAGFIIIGGLTFSPDKVFNGSTVELACSITTLGYSEDVEFIYWWTYRRNQLQPTDQSRYSVSILTDPVFYEYKHSKLQINPILTYQSGLYGCHIEDPITGLVKEKLVEIQVLSQPIVYITPMSVTVQYGENVNVTCGLAVSHGTFRRFVWYKNGSPFQASSNEIVIEASSSVTIRVIRIQENAVYGCEGVNEAGSSKRVFSNIGVIPLDPKESDFCPVSNDGRGTTWPVSAADTIVRVDCNTDYTGEIYRVCSPKGVWEPPVYDCVRQDLEDIERNVVAIKDGSEPLNLTDVLANLEQATADKTLYEGDIDSAVKSLEVIVDIIDDPNENERVARRNSYIETCSSLIDEPNALSWISSIETKDAGAIDIPKLVDDYNRKFLEHVPEDTVDPISVKNIHILLGSGRKETYTFPDRSDKVPDWIASTKSEIVIQGEAFKDIPEIRYAGSFYRNITPILVKRLKTDGDVRDVSSKYIINSDIVAFQLKDTKSLVIDPPAEITFQHFTSNASDPVCCYWDFDIRAFVTDGCSLVSTDEDYTVCQCNHFTNFAVLMSPGRTPEIDAMALSIISAVGCGISILCLVVTIILYAIVWRFVKSDRAVLLMNLCIALIISYIVFLAGVTRTENKDVCTAVSILLHYFYLVVFFLMLAYGIEIVVCVVYVFFTSSRIKWLLPLAWGVPLVIVGISMGATQLEGYGNERFCWLSTDDGLLWAFVGPAAAIIVANLIIVIIVLRQMFKSSAMMTKSDKEKAVTGVRSICVLLPILGLTWVFGVFSVNEDLVAFQYIFAICNTLQGFFIFLFHCVFNKQLKQALKQRRERKKSLASIENTFKNPHSSSASTGYISSSTKLNQDVEINVGTSNPFLEADRQMKELVGKNKKGANINDNYEANNKVEMSKNSKAVDLDDVKISNIIRESEVMGGMTGVSSILQVDNKEEDKNKDIPSPSSRTQGFGYDSESYQTDTAPAAGYQKPQGYDKLLQNAGRDRTVSKESVHSGSDRSREREREREKQREKERERERELEKERQMKIEKEKRERIEKEAMERERMERENEQRERRERELKEREQKERAQRELREREQRENERYRDRGVIRIGYTNEGYTVGDDRRRNTSPDRRTQQRSTHSSRTDDDYEARLYERKVRMNRVHMPYRLGSGSSTQNLSSISTALPEKFELQQGKKRQQKEAKKHAENSLNKKDKKKSSLKDRSKAYEYPYESTYMGDQSRHASLENMNMQGYMYSPYAQAPGYTGYQTGRPTVQQQHWDQYAYARGPPARGQPAREPRDPYDPYSRDPYRRDYW